MCRATPNHTIEMSLPSNIKLPIYLHILFCQSGNDEFKLRRASHGLPCCRPNHFASKVSILFSGSST